MLSDGPACFVDCLAYEDFCAESDCYADCTSCQQTFVDEVLCGSFSYSYACDSYSFDFGSFGFGSFSFGRFLFLIGSGFI